METPTKPVVPREEVVFNPGPGYEPKIWSPLLDPKHQAAVKEWEEKYQAGVKARLANHNEKKRLAKLGLNKTPSQVQKAKRRKLNELDLMSPSVNKLTSPNSPFLYKKTESKLVNGPAEVSRTLFAEEATSGGRRSKRRTKKQSKRRRQTRRR